LYVYPPSSDSEDILIVPETGFLDLSPLMREILYLSFPLQALCWPDCAGLCPHCGQNRNEGHCEHPETEIDPRLAVLKTLLPKT
jgi:uncharacterized protein